MRKGQAFNGLLEAELELAGFGLTVELAVGWIWGTKGIGSEVARPSTSLNSSDERSWS